LLLLLYAGTAATSHGLGKEQSREGEERERENLYYSLALMR